MRSSLGLTAMAFPQSFAQLLEMQSLDLCACPRTYKWKTIALDNLKMYIVLLEGLSKRFYYKLCCLGCDESKDLSLKYVCTVIYEFFLHLSLNLLRRGWKHPAFFPFVLHWFTSLLFWLICSYSCTSLFKNFQGRGFFDVHTIEYDRLKENSRHELRSKTLIGNFRREPGLYHWRYLVTVFKIILQISQRIEPLFFSFEASTTEILLHDS